MRMTNRRDSTLVENDATNYKQLYFDCKKNVAIFMSQVEAEISSILKKHELQKRALQDEIERLRSELKDQSHNTSMHFSKISIHSNPKRRASDSKINTQTSVSRDAVEQYLTKLSKVSFQPKEEHKNKQIRESINNEKKVACSQNEQMEKQNLPTPSNADQSVELDLKILSTGPKRETRMRQRRMENSEKMDNIKDVLKDIRGKLTNRDKNGSCLKERNQPIKTVITPDLFTQKKRS